MPTIYNLSPYSTFGNDVPKVRHKKEINTRQVKTIKGGWSKGHKTRQSKNNKMNEDSIIDRVIYQTNDISKSFHKEKRFQKEI